MVKNMAKDKNIYTAGLRSLVNGNSRSTIVFVNLLLNATGGMLPR